MGRITLNYALNELQQVPTYHQTVSHYVDLLFAAIATSISYGN
jgi:hypothetical protein